MIAARLHYAQDMDEHGNDAMETPHPDIKAAMEIMGMTYECAVKKLVSWPHNDPERFPLFAWEGNDELAPVAHVHVETQLFCNKCRAELQESEMDAGYDSGAKQGLCPDCGHPVVAKEGFRLDEPGKPPRPVLRTRRG